MDAVALAVRAQYTAAKAGIGVRWADIAHECGYADQSHLNRDFRELAGTTPTAYVAARLPDGLGVRA